MVTGRRKIQWDNSAINSFRAAIRFIRNDSIKNAEKVKKEILAKINGLKDHPEKYPLDKYMLINDGVFRAFELHHFRVRYAVTIDKIIIIQIRHTSMLPLT